MSLSVKKKVASQNYTATPHHRGRRCGIWHLRSPPVSETPEPGGEGQVLTVATAGLSVWVPNAISALSSCKPRTAERPPSHQKEQKGQPCPKQADESCWFDLIWLLEPAIHGYQRLSARVSLAVKDLREPHSVAWSWSKEQGRCYFYSVIVIN